MCGGAGSRLKINGEKPMIVLGGKHYVERVLEALEKSGRFAKIIAGVSPKTPRTRELLSSRGIEIIDTPGEGFSQDLSLLLAKLVTERVLVVPADIPLLTPEAVSEVVDILTKERGHAISIVTERAFVEGIGVKPSVIVDGDHCHSGVTLFDASIALGPGPVDEHYVTMNRLEIAVNVNTKEEKELAELLLSSSLP